MSIKSQISMSFMLLMFLAATNLSAATTSLPSTEDAQVVEGYPASNYGAATYLYVQSASSDSYKNERTWLKFDLTSLPTGATINSAKLRLYYWKVHGSNTWIAAHGCDDDAWTESAIT